MLDWQREASERLARLDAAGKLSLRGRGRMTPPELAAVLALPGFGRVRALDLTDQPGLGDDGMAVLAASQHLGHLEALILRGCQVGPAGLAALVTASGFRAVKQLDLGTTGRGWSDPRGPTGHVSATLWLSPIGDAGLEALAGLPADAALDTLTLEYPEASAGGWLAFCASPAAARLRTLSLEGAQLGPPALARAASNRLISLSLAQCRLRVDGVRALLTGSALAAMRSLTICLDTLGQDGGRAIAQAAPLGRLEVLDLYGAGLGNGGAGELAAARALGSLVSLNLTSNNIGPVGARALAARSGLPALRRLGLGDNALGTGQIETYYDGASIVGEGEVPLSEAEIAAQFFPGQPIEIFTRKRE